MDTESVTIHTLITSSYVSPRLNRVRAQIHDSSPTRWQLVSNRSVNSVSVHHLPPTSLPSLYLSLTFPLFSPSFFISIYFLLFSFPFLSFYYSFSSSLHFISFISLPSFLPHFSLSPFSLLPVDHFLL